ncbi:hypothetical protein FIBSPDRAFT_871075 [Athelia psychrophila]|uniref:Uncharacterized protein n=1 Tax=Athelia psychrophila TaxID=1759441 RepID=A0A166AJV9_9AGAM|nr:hypothetical protein FIBSPDRAFT_871075 [Fibularhizoctonia sp. CBS 109695]
MYRLYFVLRRVDCSKGYSGTSADEFRIAGSRNCSGLLGLTRNTETFGFEGESIVPKGIPEHLLTSFTFVPLYQAPTVPDVNESVSASGSAKTTGYGRVLDASPTVFRIEKAAGQEVRINPYKASAEATAETSEIAGQSLPKCASVVATVNLIAIEGKGGDASAGLVIDSTIGIMGTSLDLKLLGTGTGPVMSVWTKHIRSGPVIPNPLTIGSWWGDMWSKVNEALTPRRPSSPSPALDRFLKTAFGKFISDPKFVEALENVADLVVYK